MKKGTRTRPRRLRLGVNIDHVATIRNARGGRHPDPVRAAIIAAEAGADGITAHLREDRRHISDGDIERLTLETSLPLNLEMAATEEMLEIALRHRPNAVCLVPEKREELTTEGGLDVAGGRDHLASFVRALQEDRIRVSLFIDPEEEQIHAAADLNADIVEIHTGAYCDAEGRARDAELTRIRKAVEQAGKAGLEVHAGHGLTFETVGPVAALKQVVELNIGHFMMGEAIFRGLADVIHEMRKRMERARKPAGKG